MHPEAAARRANRGLRGAHPGRMLFAEKKGTGCFSGPTSVSEALSSLKQPVPFLLLGLLSACGGGLGGADAGGFDAGPFDAGVSSEHQRSRPLGTTAVGNGFFE